MNTALHRSHPTVNGLVERQLRNWELARRQHTTVPEGKRPAVADFICLSRLAGINVEGVAHRLGEAIEWAVFDRELLRAMAENDETREAIYANMDERDLGWHEESLRAVLQPEFVKNDYFRRLTSTVLSLARQGSAIFVGRACDLILPKSLGLRVRLVAPVEWRVEAFARAKHLTTRQARSTIQRVESERREFVHNHFAASADDPARFDLILNVARFDEKAVTEQILLAQRLGFAPTAAMT